MRIVLILFLLGKALTLSAQQVVLRGLNQPLSDVLTQLKETHNVHLSYNDRLIENCRVTESGTFDSAELAIAKLLEACSLNYENKNGVLVIFKQNEPKQQEAPCRSPIKLKGKVIDHHSKEALPFSSIVVDKTPLVTDVNGSFAFTCMDSLVHLKISYLGYQGIDTIFVRSDRIVLELAPKTVGLKAIEISDYSKETAMPRRSDAGLIKLNHKVAKFLPGNNDNTIFNLLRLQPGILAAGEQSKDFIIWGSYAGQTSVLFDGITLFSTSSAYDNIGAVNPLIVKDIEVHKGGYNVDLGDRTGGFVNITSKSGSVEHISGSINLSNQAVSGILNVPIGERAAFQTAFRQTYFKFFGWKNVKGRRGQFENSNFRDINLKYAGTRKNGDTYFISFLNSNDNFKRSRQIEEDDSKYFVANEMNTIQMGGSVFYNRLWGNGGNTNITLASTSLSSTFDNFIKIDRFKELSQGLEENNKTSNEITETSLRFDHHYTSNKSHSMKIGAALIENTTSFDQSARFVTSKASSEKLDRVNAYVKERVHLSKKVTMEPGLKIDVPLQNLSPYIQPRLRAEFMAHKNVRFNFAAGRYHQFIAENAILDPYGNAVSYWNIKDDHFKIVPSANHLVSGVGMDFRGFELKPEAFYRTTTGLLRFIQHTEEKELLVGKGEGRTYGLDLYVKKEIGKHDFWAAYTLSKSEELFDYFNSDAYQRAPQDQRHEVKGAAILNFSPLYISVNYVFGSGIPKPSISVASDEDIVYSRLDASILYKFKTKNLDMETGISILNVLNRENVSFTNFSHFPDNKTVFDQATPFTPTAFLHFAF